MKTYPLEITDDLLESLKTLPNANEVLHLLCVEWHSYPKACDINCDECSFYVKDKTK